MPVNNNCYTNLYNNLFVINRWISPPASYRLMNRNPEHRSIRFPVTINNYRNSSSSNRSLAARCLLTGLPGPGPNKPAAKPPIWATSPHPPTRLYFTRRTNSERSTVASIHSSSPEHSGLGVPTAIGHQSILTGTNVQAINVVWMVLVDLTRFRRRTVIPYPII